MLLQKGKKLNILSLVVSLSMALNVAWSSIPVKAEVVFPITDKAELSVEFLGISEDNRGPASEAQKGGITEGDVGKVFWVGVTVKDAYKLTENFTAAGIYSMDIAFDYNPEYIEPCSDMAGSTGEKGNKTTWLETIKHFNLSQGVNSDDNLYWDSSMYEVVDSACVINAEPDADSHRESPPVDGHKMMFLTIKNNDGNGNARFKGLTAVEDTKYLIRVPFVVNKVPDDISGTVTDCLKLSLGPQTFVIGSGENGYESYGAWEKEDKTIPEVNLKNYFDWMGDLNVFQTATSQITDIQVYQYVDDSLQDPETPVTPKQYDIYKDVDMTEGNQGFAADTFEYYTAVDADTNEITLRILPNLGEGIKVNFNDGEITTIPDAGNDWIDTGPIGELEIVNMEVDDGFNNTITVTCGDTVYTLHVRRYRNPEIVLNYGNSPAGLIMNMPSPEEDPENGWDDVKKADALALFKDSNPNDDDDDPINKKYSVGYIPKGGQPNLIYVSAAWAEYEENYDLNEHALFVYQGSTFADPGYKVIDELGREVLLTDSSVGTMETELVVKEQLTQGISDYDTDNDVQDLTLTPDADGVYSLRNVMIRTDVYEMKYTYTFTQGTPETEDDVKVEGVRPVIILGRRGDVYLTELPATDQNDVDDFKRYRIELNDGNTLVAFRCLDFEILLPPAISQNDLDQFTKNRITINDSMEQYYSYYISPEEGTE